MIEISFQKGMFLICNYLRKSHAFLLYSRIDKKTFDKNVDKKTVQKFHDLKNNNGCELDLKKNVS